MKLSLPLLSAVLLMASAGCFSGSGTPASKSAVDLTTGSSGDSSQTATPATTPPGTGIMVNETSCQSDPPETLRINTPNNSRTIDVPCWPDISIGGNHLVLDSHKNAVELLVRNSQSVDNPRASFLLLSRVSRTVFTEEFPLHPGETGFFNLTLPSVEGRQIFAAQCICLVFANLGSSGLHAEIGNSSLVTEEGAAAVVEYNAASPESLLPPHILSDQADLNLDPYILHWTFDFAFNADGHVQLTAPSGLVLIDVDCSGRTLEGHFSDGFRPHEAGIWLLNLTGYGWFELKVRSWLISAETLQDELGGQ